MLTWRDAIAPAERLRYQNLPEELTEDALQWKRDYIAREKLEADAYEPDYDEGEGGGAD